MEKAVLSEGVLIRWLGGGKGLMKDDSRGGRLLFDASNFLRKSEGCEDNVGKRCRYVIDSSGDGRRVSLKQIRILTGPQRRDSRTKQPQKKVEKRRSHILEPKETCWEKEQWTVVCNTKRKLTKPVILPRMGKLSELKKFLEIYRFLGQIDCYDSESKSGIISSNQLGMRRVEFNESNVKMQKQETETRLVRGKKVFFFLCFDDALKVNIVHFAADYMTEQRVSGIIYAWNGHEGKVRLPNLKIPMLLYTDYVSTGKTELITPDLKLNCTIFLNNDLEVEARDVNLYTKSFRPKSSQTSPRLKKEHSQATEEDLSYDMQCLEIPKTQLLNPTGDGPSFDKHSSILKTKVGTEYGYTETVTAEVISPLMNGCCVDAAFDPAPSGYCGGLLDASPEDAQRPNPLYKRKSSLCEDAKNCAQPKDVLTESTSSRNVQYSNVPEKKIRTVKKSGSSTKANNSWSKRGHENPRQPTVRKKNLFRSPDLNENQEESKENDFSKEVASLSAETESMLQIKDFAGKKKTRLAESIEACSTKEDLEAIFTELKPEFTALISDQSGSQVRVLTSFLRKVSKLSDSLERKMTRIIRTCYPGVLESKAGCEILKICFNVFQIENKQILAEGLLDLDADNLAKFLVHGSMVFKLALGVLDEKDLCHLSVNLSGYIVRFACHFKCYIAIKELIIGSRNFASLENIAEEMQSQFSVLAFDRFGSKVLISLIENASYCIEEKIFESLVGHIKDLATHPHGHKVLISALNHFSSDNQDFIIEQIMQEKSAEAQSSLINLVLHKEGHLVVIKMIQASHGRHSSKELKARLFKQEVMSGNEFAIKVLNVAKWL